MSGWGEGHGVGQPGPEVPAAEPDPRDLDAYDVDHGIQLAAPRLIGARVKRVEDPRLITGRGRYVGDVALPRMVHATFVRSPEAHARIRSIDVEAARALPGVIDVVIGEDLARGNVRAIRADAGYPNWQSSEFPVLAVDRVRFVGESMVLIVAESRSVAEDAGLVDLDLEPLPPVPTMDAALAEATTPLNGWTSNCFVSRTIESGDVDAAFAEADHTLSFRFTTQRYAAMPMETRAVVADYDEYADMLTVWDSTQVPHLARTCISDHIGQSEHHVRVIAPDVGGGFGLKCVVFPEEIAIADAARRLRRPVKWVEDRVEDLTGSAHARDTRDDVEIAFNADGELRAVRGTVVVNSGAYSVWPFTASMELGTGMAQLPEPYRVRHFRAHGYAVAANKALHGPYRGVSRPASCFALERAIDEAARMLDMDPLEFRKRNLIRSDEFPMESAGGYVFDSDSYVESMDKLAEMSGLGDLRRRQAALRVQGRYMGIGVSCFNEQTAHSFAKYAKRGTPVVVGYDKAIVRMDAGGKVTVFVDTHSQGQGHEASLAQLVAAQLDVPIEDVRVRFGDTESAPSGMGTFASRSMPTGRRRGPARHQGGVREAGPARRAHAGGQPRGRRARGQRSASGRRAGTDRGDPGHRPDGAPAVEQAAARRGPDARGLARVSWRSRHRHVPELRPPRSRRDRQRDRQGVDSRYHVLEDCGPVINPMLVEGQIHRGVAQGIGGALHEHLLFDQETGQQSTTFLDYLMPSAKDVPDIQLEHLWTLSPSTPGGIKGAAEAGTTGAPAAIANALHQIGPVLVDELPLTPERAFGYVQEASRAATSTTVGGAR